MVQEQISPKWYTSVGAGTVSAGYTWHNRPNPKLKNQKKDVTCGGVQGEIFCGGEERHAQDVLFHCDRQDCPVCWQRWMAREEMSIGERLGWAARNGAGRERHYVVSFRTLPYRKTEYTAMRRDAVAKCKRLGITGGVMVPHIAHRQGVGLTLHFHVAGFGNFRFDKVKKDYERNGIILKYIRDIWEIRDLSNYELDHGIKVFGCQTVTWFGIVSTRNIMVFEKTESQDAHCEICGAVMFDDRDLGTPDGGSVCNIPHKELTTIRSYSWAPIKRHEPRKPDLDKYCAPRLH